MFETFLRRLMAPAPPRLPEPEAHLALAALMVRIARTDGDYAPAEKTRIDRVLGATYALTPEAAAVLRHEAEQLETEAPDTVRFTRALKDAVALEHRIGLVEALWEVALADGSRGAEEESLLRLVSSLLGISDPDSALARQRAEAK